jgi:hypothetical protein
MLAYDERIETKIKLLNLQLLALPGTINLRLLKVDLAAAHVVVAV